MKQGVAIDTLESVLQEGREKSRDFVIKNSRLVLDVEANKLHIPTIGEFDLSDTAHTQIAEKAGIPVGFYNKLRKGDPDLLTELVQPLWQRYPKKQLVRTFYKHTSGEGHSLTRPDIVRAILGKNYFCINNDDLVTLTRLFTKKYNLTVESANVSDSYLYLKVSNPIKTFSLRKGDVVQVGFYLKNSEVGLGLEQIGIFVKVLKCMNGLMLDQNIFSQTRKHFGKEVHGDSSMLYKSDKSKRLDYEQHLSQVSDMLYSITNGDMIDRAVQSIQRASDTPLPTTADSEDVVQVVQKTFGLTDEERKRTLENYIRDDDKTLWGLSNAVTATAEGVDSYDRATELERFGGKILQSSSTYWAQKKSA